MCEFVVSLFLVAWNASVTALRPLSHFLLKTKETLGRRVAKLLLVRKRAECESIGSALRWYPESQSFSGRRPAVSRRQHAMQADYVIGAIV